jgi:hypothetical protein
MDPPRAPDGLLAILRCHHGGHVRVHKPIEVRHFHGVTATAANRQHMGAGRPTAYRHSCHERHHGAGENARPKRADQPPGRSRAGEGLAWRLSLTGRIVVPGTTAFTILQL